MANQFFLSGIGTGIGKTLIAAILSKALDADYWKPIQAGYQHGTDSHWIRERLPDIVIHPEVYKLKLAASPHIAAREEGINISLKKIYEEMPVKNRNLIIEGPGGLMVPLNEREFVTDLIDTLQTKVILVSRNYLGSINHSLLTSELCKQKNIPVVGWIFNDQYLSYEEEIINWSGYPGLASVPFTEDPNHTFITTQARILREQLEVYL
jgi:dethiobiotin synthetase